MIVAKESEMAHNTLRTHAPPSKQAAASSRVWRGCGLIVVAGRRKEKDKRKVAGIETKNSLEEPIFIGVLV